MRRTADTTRWIATRSKKLQVATGNRRRRQGAGRYGVQTSDLVFAEPHDVEGFYQLLVQFVVVERAVDVAMRQVAVVPHVIQQVLL